MGKAYIVIEFPELNAKLLDIKKNILKGTKLVKFLVESITILPDLKHF